jgi:FtsH-binding integral membrane protein
LIATTGLLIAAIARWPMMNRNAIFAALVSYVFLIVLVGYDLWSTRKIHRATLWAGIFLIVVQQIRLPIGQSAAWHAFATWVQSATR